MKNIITVSPPNNPIVIGKIRGVYGIRGWMKIISFTDKSDGIFQYDPWFVLFETQWKLMRLECWKLIKKYYIVKIIDISNREIAKLLTNSDLVIDDSQLPSLCDGEYYWKDIIGCQVVTITGNIIGYIDYIIETIAHDVLVVKKIPDKYSIKTMICFIPFVQNAIIKNIDLISNIIVVDWDYTV